MKFKISIVEPNSNVRHALLNAFQNSEFNLSNYSDGTSALDGWAKEMPDLVLFEWNLPDYSGAKFCDKISNQFPNLPFYILSEVRDMNVKIEALQAGALDFLVKPFDRVILLAKIRAALRLYRNGSPASSSNGSKSNNGTPFFVEYLTSKKIGTIKPSSDIKSKYGFSYKLLSRWKNQELNPDKQLEFLESLVTDGWLVKRIYDIVKMCPKCSSFQLNIRKVCPECHSPILTQDLQIESSENNIHSEISNLNNCSMCHSKYKDGLTFARCWSCEFEFKEEEAKVTTVYSFSLKPGTVSYQEECILQKILMDHGLQTLPENMFEAFLRLEKNQHNLVQKPYAVLRLCFSIISQVDNSSINIKKISSVVLLLKKLIQPQDALFFKSPDELILFFSYTDPHTAEERAEKINSYLERLELVSFVQIDLTTHNYSKILTILEQEIEAV